MAASTRDAENVGVAVVVCMRDSYSDPAAVKVVFVVVVVCVSRHRLWAEKFRSLHERNEWISLLLCHCVAARWFESVLANRMDAQSKQVTLLVQ